MLDPMKAIMAASFIAILLAAPARAATIGDSVNICAELRTAVPLAAIEVELEARGYTAYHAGEYTGTVLRDHCPELIPAVKAQLS